MSHGTENEVELDEEELPFTIDDEDFGFLIDSQGKLKTIFGPDVMMNGPPENVQKILDIFGLESSVLAKQLGITVH